MSFFDSLLSRQSRHDTFFKTFKFWVKCVSKQKYVFTKRRYYLLRKCFKIRVQTLFVLNNNRTYNCVCAPTRHAHTHKRTVNWLIFTAFSLRFCSKKPVVLLGNFTKIFLHYCSVPFISLNSASLIYAYTNCKDK